MRNSSPATTLRQARLAVTAAVLATASVVLAACDPPQPSLPTPPPPAAATPAALAAASPISVAYCPDATSSYPQSLRENATESLIAMLARLIGPGFPGVRLATRWITEHTRALDAGIGTFGIPAVEAKPVRAADTPAPQPLDEQAPQYLFDKKALARARTAYEEAMRDWQATVAANTNAFEDAKARYIKEMADAGAALAAIADRLRAAVPPVATGSDQTGCIVGASAFFSHAPGPTYLIIASDMQPYGSQDGADAPLPGVKVSVINFYCDTATACVETQSTWAPVFQSAGVASVEYYDPSEDVIGIIR